MKFVYIVKESESNPELKYSLRSLDKCFSNPDVTIVGYKPSWVKNVGYLRVKQSLGSAWKNSTLNLIKICESNLVDDFVLMNDDFFILRKFSEGDLDVCMGTVQNRVNYVTNNKIKNLWYSSFIEHQKLIGDLGISEYDFEIHCPMIVNKFEFLKMINDPLVKKFRDNHEIFLKRTIYKNMFLKNAPKKVEDFKIDLDKDIDLNYNRFMFSTYHNTLSKNFKNINKLLIKDKSYFEV